MVVVLVCESPRWFKVSSVLRRDRRRSQARDGRQNAFFRTPFASCLGFDSLVRMFSKAVGTYWMRPFVVVFTPKNGGAFCLMGQASLPYKLGIGKVPAFPAMPFV